MCHLLTLVVNVPQTISRLPGTPGDAPVDYTHVPSLQDEPRSLLNMVSSRGRPDACGSASD